MKEPGHLADFPYFFFQTQPIIIIIERITRFDFHSIEKILNLKCLIDSIIIKKTSTRFRFSARLHECIENEKN